MVHTFHQLVYHNDSSNYNNPPGLRATTVSDEIAKYTPICQLGIRALPGTKFYINHNIHPIIVGFSGLFEINLSDIDGGVISSLEIDQGSLRSIRDQNNAYLILDMISEEVGGEDEG